MDRKKKESKSARIRKYSGVYEKTLKKTRAMKKKDEKTASKKIISERYSERTKIKSSPKKKNDVKTI